MKRFLVVIIIIVAIAVLLFAFSGCKDKTQYFNVTFNVDNYNADTPDTLRIAKGGLIVAPEIDCAPQNGYELAWFTDQSFTNIFDFTTPITSNLTLYLGETGLIYSITYTDIDEDWFDISQLPTEYQVGVGVALPNPPEPSSQITKGYYAGGNWYVGNRDIGYLINDLEIGDLILHFRANPIEYTIQYINIARIDLSDENYAEYITNDNPLTYKITDGTIILKNPTVSVDCPHPEKEFLRWELVNNTNEFSGTPITEITIDTISGEGQNPPNPVFLRAIWVYED